MIDVQYLYEKKTKLLYSFHNNIMGFNGTLEKGVSAKCVPRLARLHSENVPMEILISDGGGRKRNWKNIRGSAASRLEMGNIF